MSQLRESLAVAERLAAECSKSDEQSKDKERAAYVPPKQLLMYLVR